MTTKEKVVRESIARVEKRILEIDEVLEADQLGELIKVFDEGQKLLDENQGVEKRTSPAFVEKINALAKRDKKLRKAVKETCGVNHAVLCTEKAKLSIELGELKNELYYIESRKGGSGK